MTNLNRNEWDTYLMFKKFDKEAAHDYKIQCKKRHNLIKKNSNIFDIHNAANWSLVKSYGIDGYIIKMLYPNNLNMFDKKEIEDALTINKNYSAYDCTGRAFTSWISFFDVPQGCIIYHSIGFDY